MPKIYIQILNHTLKILLKTVSMLNIQVKHAIYIWLTVVENVAQK
jgi:hypothetical protein